jgi:hypothetical protein
MTTFTNKGEEEVQEVKIGYWRNELYSLGILEPKRNKKEEVKESKAELENLANIIKQTMFEDYKLAYSEEGDAIEKKQNRLLLLDDCIKKSIL